MMGSSWPFNAEARYAFAVRTFFTADTHFGHGGARGLYRRPFPSVAAMDACMIERWNAAVDPTDTVYHLGDFAVGHPDPARLLAGLHGAKHLVMGNNDPAVPLPGWAGVERLLEIVVDGVALVLCHYALRTWPGQSRGAWNLHGHSHGRLAPMTRQVDVGVDVWGFAPVALAAIQAARSRAKRNV